MISYIFANTVLVLKYLKKSQEKNHKAVNCRVADAKCQMSETDNKNYRYERSPYTDALKKVSENFKETQDCGASLSNTAPVP